LLLDGIVAHLTGWGILATGHIASVFARDLALLPDEARLVAVGSRSLERAMAFAADHGIPRAYDTYAELAGDPMSTWSTSPRRTMIISPPRSYASRRGSPY
jgi:hypothetical protein